MIVTPKFWKTKNVISYALLPLSVLYILIGKIRKAFGRKFTIPNKFVVCIGNITVGGTGKTPTTIALVKELQKNYSVCVLTKGYKRKVNGFFKIEPFHTPMQIGDEPYIMAKIASVYLYDSVANLAENYHFITEDIIIMDDGMQNNVAKNFVLMLIGRQGLANCMVFPAGGMRETLKSGLNAVSAILYTSNTKIHAPNVTAFKVKIVADCNAPIGENYIAFSGLGDNEKFKISLQEFGYNIVCFIEFEDHCSYATQDLAKIEKIARNLNCKIITTEKDFVKLPKYLQDMVFVLHHEYQLPSELIENITVEIQACL